MPSNNLVIIIALAALLATVPVVLSGCVLAVDSGGDSGHKTTYWTHDEPSNHSDEQAANRTLARTIRDKLEQNKMLLDENIGVEADDGDITLRGHVHSTAALQRAIQVAKNAPHVNSVKSRIVVEIDGEDSM